MWFQCKCKVSLMRRCSCIQQKSCISDLKGLQPTEAKKQRECDVVNPVWLDTMGLTLLSHFIRKTNQNLSNRLLLLTNSKSSLNQRLENWFASITPMREDSDKTSASDVCTRHITCAVHSYASLETVSDFSAHRKFPRLLRRFVHDSF